MAYSKIILNGETLMDVTSDTVAAGSLLSGKTATKNDGTKVTGNISTKTSSDLTVSGATVTAPAGYYSVSASKSITNGTATTPATTITTNPTITLSTTTGIVTATYAGSSSITPTIGAGYISTGTAGTISTTGTSTYQLTVKSAADMTVAAQSVTAPAGYYSQNTTKAVATTTHPNPTAAIASSTGVVTATHTQTTGYVTSGTTTGTLNLTTQAAQTINTSTADQTVASYRWLTGAQTIKSVTTTNLTAANIAEGVTVKVGDANNASRISQVTGTYAPAVSSATITPTETAQTLNATGVYGYKPVTVNAISSTYVGTGVAKKSSADTTFASTTGTFTAPIGYYSAAATKTITINAAQTIYPSTADQTISSYRWLTGTQTIKSVTTTNLTAANIADGVVVKVGDAIDASRIIQVTGTHSGGSGGGFTADQIGQKNLMTGEAIGQSATGINLYAFYLAGITYASFSQVVAIGSSAFGYCTSLVSISFPLVSRIESFAFASCTSLVSANLPLLSNLYTSAFSACTNLISVDFPALINIPSYAFRNCNKLTNVSTPNAQKISASAFYLCTSISTLSFPNATSIQAGAFYGCYRLLSLYLLGSSVAYLGGTNAFTSTPISTYTTQTGGVNGSIFVPASLYDTYISSTYWSVYSSRFVSV